MKRILQVVTLVCLMVVAILAKTIDDFVAAAPAGETSLLGSATLHFEGSVTKEENGVLTVSGTAALSDLTVSLPSTTWQAEAEVPVRRNSRGSLQLARQGQLRVRLVRAGVVRYTLIASVTDIRAVIDRLNGLHWVLVDGEVDVHSSDSLVDDFENTAIASLETEFQLTNPWGPTEFQWTLEQMETMFPVTNTPSGGPDGPGVTSPPTVAGPNS